MEKLTREHRPVEPSCRRSVGRLLVVSDNQELSLFLKEELVKNDFSLPLQVDFRYTSFNHDPQPMIDIGAEIIDMKDEATVSRILRHYDMVFSLHCKQIFPARLVENVRCVNFHPGFNPYNRGWYPQAFSILNGLPIGSTIHLMNEDIDNGEIIAQREVAVEVSDTSYEVYRKVVAVEKELIRENISSLITGTFQSSKPVFDGNLNLIKDYHALCRLDLEATGTFREHLNILRATTHGSFKNAYFTEADGTRYYVRITIEQDA